MILISGNASNGRRTCPNTIVANKGSTWTGVRLKPGLQGETLANNHFSHGMGIVKGLT